MKKLLVVLLLIATSVTKVFAGDNEVKGKVLDETDNKPIIGATVRIEGTKLGDKTDKKGKFEIDDIKLKKAVVLVTYVGYQESRTEVDFEKDDDIELTIRIKPADVKIKDVIVVGEAEGQSKALIEQKRAENIKNVVSSEQIAQFPDINAAEAIQRIPGISLQRDQGEGRYVQLRGTPPELTNFNVNGEQIPSPEGDVRFVGMDIISADQIEFIEVTKVLTPDMDADGIGGNVNIITKKATGTKPSINAATSAGYNNLRGTDNYDLQFNFGQRYEGFGFNMNSSYYLNNQGSDNMEFKYAKGPFWGSTGSGKDNYFVQYREAQLRHYTIRERIGLSGTMDYQFDENHTVYLRGMYNNFTDDELRRRKLYDLEDAISENFYLNSNVNHDVRQRQKIQNISTLNLGAEKKFGFLDLDYELSYSSAIEDQPDYFEATFGSTGQYIAIKFDKSNENMPVATFPDSTNAPNATAYNKFALDELLFQTINVRDDNLTGKVNIKIPYSINASNSGYVKLVVNSAAN